MIPYSAELQIEDISKEKPMPPWDLFKLNFSSFSKSF